MTYSLPWPSSFLKVSTFSNHDGNAIENVTLLELHTCLLLNDFEVRTVSCGPSYFPRTWGHKSTGEKRGSVTYSTNPGNEVSKIFILERFSIQCRKTKTKTKVITPTNHKKRKQHNGSIRPDQNSKQMNATGAKRGKTRASKARLVLVLLLIG